MKYLLKFKIETWGNPYPKKYNLTLKVEFIEKMLKTDGFCHLGLKSRWNVQARWIFHLKSCEVVEGPQEVRDLNNDRVRFFLWRNDCQDYVVIALQIYDGCIGVNLMGFEAVPDEEPQPISSPSE